MKALISINDTITDYEGTEGQRLLDIVENDATFPVNSEMTWIDCPGVADGADALVIGNYQSQYWYKDNAFSLIPVDPEL